ncbi:MAG TPA: homoserine kinase [Terriglobales bacterium]|nr:homoserine kinase [Terriglobales bacterium]
MDHDFELSIPASSANLGPAFDAAALAWTLCLKVRARCCDHFEITAAGRDAAIAGNPGGHMVVETYLQTLAAAGREAQPLAIHLENEIPIGRGCGSSAAARLAGVALASCFGDLKWSAQEVFEAAARAEGHPDNVAAAWWGGLVIAQGGGEHFRWIDVPVAKPWAALLAVPQQPLATSDARAVLPEQYSRQDAVANLQAALLLICAFQQGRGDLLGDALSDRWHEPYRAALCPLLPALRPLAGRSGILGVALSGAGPSVLLLLDSADARTEASAAARAAIDAARLEAELLFAEIETRAPGRKWKP